jgi:peroxiredoxin
MNVKWNLVLAACCLLLLGMNVALIRQNRILKEQISQPPPSLEAPIGAQMPELKGFDPTGRQFSIAYGKDPRKVLVFVYSPSCQFCTQNWPKWQQLFPELDHAVRTIGVDVSATSTMDYIARQFKDLPVVTQVDPKDMVDYHLRLTPQTILVSETGKVEKVWSGVLTDANVAEIKSMIGKNTISAVRALK